VAGHPQPTRDALKRVAVALKDAGVPFALAGSYASWARGGPEPNHDVDFLVIADDVDRALKVCHEHGLRIERPPEDWLAKVYDETSGHPVLVDLIHRTSGGEVTPEALNRADILEVDAVAMPVISATLFVGLRLHALSEHACDFGSLLPHVRALREQVDWPRLRVELAGRPFAEAFLFLCTRLGILDD
jgi:predicted nucleotidyltransferase